MKLLSPSDLAAQVGKELGVSDWYEVTQENVNLFANVTLDHQFIHIDPDKAAQSPFGGTIAHGFLSLSMLSFFAENGMSVGIEGTVMGVNYGFDKVRFINPVRVGSKIRGRSILLGLEEKNPGQYLMTLAVSVEIDGVEKPALVADWLSMLVVGS
ncbi:MAG: MaoC family dehydratase [Pseudomonadota bacterium]